MMRDNNGNTIKYENKEALNNIRTKEEKRSLKDIYKAFRGIATAVAAWFAGNNVALFFGGMLEDDIIAILSEIVGELKGFLKYAEYNKLQELLANTAISAITASREILSLLWNLAVANPVVAGIVVGGLAAAGTFVVFKLGEIVVNKIAKKGQIKTEAKVMAR